MAAKQTLRDTVSASLATLQNATRLGLTVASSTPKRTTALFPYASPAASVRCWETEHLVVVDCGLSPAEGEGEGEGEASGSGSGASDNAQSQRQPQPSSSPPSVLVAAISVNVYTLPTGKDGGPPTSLVYISKVDSSGYAVGAPGVTRALAVGVLAHFLGPDTRPSPRVLATLFARAQGQYLFPNSIEGGGKLVRDGAGLCKWWKGVYEGAARRLVQTDGVPPASVQLRFFLPGYVAAEARFKLGTSLDPPPVEWKYAPPFVAPLFSTGSQVPDPSLAVLIPSLPDDPKTRFLDEIASEALDTVPYAHTAAAAGANGNGTNATAPPSPTKARKRRAAEEDERDRKHTHAALAKVPPAEFWERIGYRQECISDMTGFFCIAVEPPQAVERPQAAEEAETELTAATDTGLSTNASASTDASASTSTTALPAPAAAPVPIGNSSRTLPVALVERLLKSLLNTDFGSRELAAEGTRGWLDSARRLIVDEVGEEGWAMCTSAVAPKAPCDPGAAGAGGVVQGVPAPKRKPEEVVTVLQPRKKKK